MQAATKAKAARDATKKQAVAKAKATQKKLKETTAKVVQKPTPQKINNDSKTKPKKPQPIQELATIQPTAKQDILPKDNSLFTVQPKVPPVTTAKTVILSKGSLTKIRKKAKTKQ